MADPKRAYAPTLPLPNPGDWCSVDGAAALLQVSRSSVYRFNDRDLIKVYYVDAVPLLWRADVDALYLARTRAGLTAAQVDA